MIDRIINLIVLLILLVAIVALSSRTYEAWNHTEAWEQSWVPIHGKNPSHHYEELTNAIRNAKSQNEFADANELTKWLEEMYQPSGKVFTRFSEEEINEIFVYGIFPLVFLIVPVSANYVRRGKFKLWNRTA